MSPRVASIVVNYEGLADTIECVDSLLASDAADHLVLVVDNGSRVDEGQLLRSHFGGRIAVVRSEQNLGFGAAANKGVRQAAQLGAQYVWILNNDTVVEPDALPRLLEAMEADPAIGILSPQIRAPVGPEAPRGIWFAGGALALWRARAAHDLEALPASADPVDVPFVTGCAMLIRRELLTSVGLFWAPLFLYWEDADLVLRARRGGWRTCVVPSAWILHRVHGSASESIASYYLFRNAPLVIWRNAGPGTLVSAIGFLGLRLARRWAGALARRRAAPWRATRGLRDGLWMLASWIAHGRSRTEGIEVLRE